MNHAPDLCIFEEIVKQAPLMRTVVHAIQMGACLKTVASDVSLVRGVNAYVRLVEQRSVGITLRRNVSNKFLDGRKH
ncbi:MAG TPA: hypothetical protein VEC35_17055 [Noviherbaspirillum sp.]|nr:hypothetical protein [Noviherbaspirillum sp.]